MLLDEMLRLPSINHPWRALDLQYPISLLKIVYFILTARIEFYKQRHILWHFRVII